MLGDLGRLLAIKDENLPLPRRLLSSFRDESLLYPRAKKVGDKLCQWYGLKN
jgi:hypothetical protein